MAAKQLRVCLIVPSGTWRLDAVASAIRECHPGAIIATVWAGDPHLRPTLAAELDMTWIDLGVNEPTGAGWPRLLIALPARSYEWALAASAVAEWMLKDSTPVVVLRVGSVGVLGALDDLGGEAPITLVARVLQPLPDDGLAPRESDVVSDGQYSTVMAGFGQSSGAVLAWLANQLASGGLPGRLLELALQRYGGAVCESPAVGAGAWRATSGQAPAVLVDLDLLDRDEPWHFTFASGPARVRLSGDLVLAAAIAQASDQIAGTPMRLTLPGGVTVDVAMRVLMSRAILAWRRGEGELPPEPYGARHSAFMSWLDSSEPATVDISRYWIEVRNQRADLQAAFPLVQSLDAQNYRQWTKASWRLEERSVLFGTEPALDHSIAMGGFDPAGVNVLGYLDFDQSQGHIARNLIDLLSAADVPVRALNHHRSLGSSRIQQVSEPRQAAYATNIVVVNADQFEFVVADHATSLLDGRHTIGYWFWELQHVPAAMVKATTYVQEIWAGSQFIADAFAAVTETPVRCVALPVAEPKPSAKGRDSFGLADDRFVFLTTFDQFSVPERKNPFGAIDAFTQAFDEDEGPILWIKTMNGVKGWRQHERLLLAASKRRDIIVWDQHLPRDDQMAVLNAADCLVSLHRSEGLGLHCAEAMWLAKPVIATRYSGNLDFMDDSNSALIDFTLVPVQHGEGIYPTVAKWAEPSREHAAEWMRRLVDNPQQADAIGQAGRLRMQQQPSMTQAGQMLAGLIGLS